MPTFDFYDMPICGEQGFTDETTTVNVEVDLVMTEPADPGIAPSLNHPGEPPWPAVYEIEEVRLTFVDSQPLLGREVLTLKLTEAEFLTFFAPAYDIINNAHEWASELEE